jgi:hypothetical protein
MLIDSPSILGATFQRCRLLRGRADIGELLELVSDILSVVEQQGKFLIDVPEGWVPEKWVNAVRGDTQRGIDDMNATMKLSDHDVLSAEKRRVISLLRLLVRELHRLWAIGADDTVRRLGHAFHNINGKGLRMPDEPGTDASMWYFRVISADWDELSLEMREGCCRAVGLGLQEAEALINTQGFAINCSGPRRFKINTLISRATALNAATVLGTVREVTVHPPIPGGADSTSHDTYSLVLEDETGSIVVEVTGTGAPVLFFQGKRVIIDGNVEVLSQGLTNRPLVKLKAQAGWVRLVPDPAIT